MVLVGLVSSIGLVIIGCVISVGSGAWLVVWVPWVGLGAGVGWVVCSSLGWQVCWLGGVGLGGQVWALSFLGVGFSFTKNFGGGGFSSASFFFVAKYFLRGVSDAGGKISRVLWNFFFGLFSAGIFFLWWGFFLDVFWGPKSIVFIRINLSSILVNSIQVFWAIFWSIFSFLGSVFSWGGCGGSSVSKNFFWNLLAGLFSFSSKFFLFCWGVFIVPIVGGLLRGVAGLWVRPLGGSWAGRGERQPGVVSVVNTGLLLVRRLGGIGKVVGVGNSGLLLVRRLGGVGRAGTNDFGGFLLVGRPGWVVSVVRLGLLGTVLAGGDSGPGLAGWWVFW